MRNLVVSFFALLAPLWAEEVHVYVSLDEEHSAKVLKQFEAETGVKVVPTFDTEASKTVGLVKRLIREKGDPQADVYWNNELATTIKLKEHGVLAPYRSPSAEGIPAEFKDAEGYWTGFAARARVLIVNTDLVKPAEFPKSMWDLCDPKWSGKTCMALPATGTTAAHAAVLYVRDEAKADEYFRKLAANRVTWLTGNAHCMREVAAGRYHFGWTDTDDFFVAKLQDRPVAQVFPDAGAGEAGVLYIPNSLVLIAGGKHADAGKRLIDWLLRPETEEALAKSATAQIPVRLGVPAPDHVRRPDQIGTTMQVDWNRVGKEYDRWVARSGEQLSAVQESGATLIWISAVVFLLVVAIFLVMKRATRDPV